MGFLFGFFIYFLYTSLYVTSPSQEAHQYCDYIPHFMARGNFFYPSVWDRLSNWRELFQCILLHCDHDRNYLIRWPGSDDYGRESTHYGICYILRSTLSLCDECSIPIQFSANSPERWRIRTRNTQCRGRCRCNYDTYPNNQKTNRKKIKYSLAIFLKKILYLVYQVINHTQYVDYSRINNK